MRRLAPLTLRILGRLALSAATFCIGASLPPKFAPRDATPREAARDATPLPPPLPPYAIACVSRPAAEQAAPAQPAAQPSPAPSEEDRWDSAPRIAPVVVSPDRMLVTLGNTLYMIDSRRRVVWRWPDDKLAPWPAINDRPLVIGDTVYVVAQDLTHVALDLKTGREKWHSTACGRASFSQLAQYRADEYLMVVDMSGYDDPFGPVDPSDKPTDRLAAFDLKNNQLWDIDFPRGATLQVWDGKIYAVARAGGSLSVTEIKPPAESPRRARRAAKR